MLLLLIYCFVFCFICLFFCIQLDGFLLISVIAFQPGSQNLGICCLVKGGERLDMVAEQKVQYCREIKAYNSPFCIRGADMGFLKIPLSQKDYNNTKEKKGVILYTLHPTNLLISLRLQKKSKIL